MKLIEYLRSIDPMSFIVCININCDAFSKIRNGAMNKETIDQITFFSGSAANVLKNVARSMGTKTSVGCAAATLLPPKSRGVARYTMMLIGISVSPLVFSTRNIIMGLVAVSFFLFSS